MDGKAIGTVEESARVIRGPAGTEVVVTVVGADEKERQLTVKREMITLPTVRGLAWDKTDTGRAWRHWIDADAKLAYVAILSFGPRTGADLRAILDRLNAEGMKGLVLDLRGNPGGILNTCVEVAQLFLSNADVVRIIGKDPQPVEVVKVTGDAPFGKVPLVVVVDGSTGSAAEVLAGALQDNKRGVILGERTHGKGSIQAILPLGKDSIKLTVRLMTTPAGRAFNRTPEATTWGIDPNRDSSFRPTLKRGDPARKKSFSRRTGWGDSPRLSRRSPSSGTCPTSPCHSRSTPCGIAFSKEASSRMVNRWRNRRRC